MVKVQASRTKSYCDKENYYKKGKNECGRKKEEATRRATGLQS